MDLRLHDQSGACQWNSSFAGNFLWTNSNFCEAICDVMTPATKSMWDIYLEATSFQILDYPLVGVIGGRPYINMSMLVSIGWAFGIKPNKMLQKSANLWGRVPENLEVPLLPLTRWQILCLALPGLLRTRWSRNVKKSDIEAFIAKCPAQCEAIRLRIRQATNGAELVDLWRVELRPFFRLAWRLVRATLESAPVDNLRHTLDQLVGDADANALLSNLNGAGQLASLGPLVGISRVARGEMDRSAYFQQYGHRGPHELELSFPRPAEAPEWLDQQIAMAGRSPVNVDALLEVQHVKFNATWQRIEQRYPLRAKSIRAQIEQVRTNACLREAVRSEATRVVWAVREFTLRAAELAGVESHQDVFFLSLDEMAGVLSGNQAALEFIPVRKELHAHYSALPPYPGIIIGRFDPFEWAADPNRQNDLFDAQASAISASGVIIGFIGAAGVVEGRVRRLDRVEEGDRLQPGEILVTTTTNVGWTPLFPRAAAIVTDVGAPLSHAAIVARELGIPAVVGCSNATLRLRTGDRVRVNGGKGTVEILEESR